MSPLDVARKVVVESGTARLHADLCVPYQAKGVILLAHGSGSSRFSPRNQFAASVLNKAGFATLLLDLLTRNEEAEDRWGTQFRFNIRILTDRFSAWVEWSRHNIQTRTLPAGFFGASTGAAAALIADAESPGRAFAVVSRGGRPDLAAGFLPGVSAPTLMLVGSEDGEVLELNRRASRHMRAERRIKVIAGATHLFEEPGTLEQAAEAASDWFQTHLPDSADVNFPDYADTGGGD